MWVWWGGVWCGGLGWVGWGVVCWVGLGWVELVLDGVEWVGVWIGGTSDREPAPSGAFPEPAQARPVEEEVMCLQGFALLQIGVRTYRQYR